LITFGCDACKGKVKTEKTAAETINNFQGDTEGAIVKTYFPEIEMVYVEGGSFQMGKELGSAGWRGDINPVHRVTVNSFYMSKCEITMRQILRDLIQGTAG